MAFGDHQAVPGHAWICRLNPLSGKIDIVVDVNKMLKPSKGKYSPGKIHAPLIDAGDGYLYFMPYRGSEKYADTPFGFSGGHLMRYHMETSLTQDLGIPLPHCSVPHIVFDPAVGQLYLFGRSCPSMPEPRHNKFGVYDVVRQRLIHIAPDLCAPEEAPRAAIVGGDGRVWYGTESHVMAVYDPRSNSTSLTNTPVIADVRTNRSTKQVETQYYLRTASGPNGAGMAFLPHLGRPFSRVQHQYRYVSTARRAQFLERSLSRKISLHGDRRVGSRTPKIVLRSRLARRHPTSTVHPWSSSIRPPENTRCWRSCKTTCGKRPTFHWVARMAWPSTKITPSCVSCGTTNALATHRNESGGVGVMLVAIPQSEH